MADIAMLVAEEYERRIKNSRKAGVDGDLVEINWGYFFHQKIKNQVFREENLQLIKKWVLEPKSQIGGAASNGFFSA